MAQESAGLGETGAGENGNANITAAGASHTRFFVSGVLCLLKGNVLRFIVHVLYLLQEALVVHTSPIRFDVWLSFVKTNYTPYTFCVSKATTSYMWLIAGSHVAVRRSAARSAQSFRQSRRRLL